MNYDCLSYEKMNCYERSCYVTNLMNGYLTNCDSTTYYYYCYCVSLNCVSLSLIQNCSNVMNWNVSLTLRYYCYDLTTTQHYYLNENLSLTSYSNWNDSMNSANLMRGLNKRTNGSCLSYVSLSYDYLTNETRSLNGKSLTNDYYSNGYYLNGSNYYYENCYYANLSYVSYCYEMSLNYGTSLNANYCYANCYYVMNLDENYYESYWNETMSCFRWILNLTNESLNLTSYLNSNGLMSSANLTMGYCKTMNDWKMMNDWTTTNDWKTMNDWKNYGWTNYGWMNYGNWNYYGWSYYGWSLNESWSLNENCYCEMKNCYENWMNYDWMSYEMNWNSPPYHRQAEPIHQGL